MKYVYLLKSIRNPKQQFIGYTEDLNDDLIAHNSWKHKETAKDVPWEIDLAIRFQDHEQAIKYHHYLCTPPGRKHLRKHMIATGNWTTDACANELSRSV